MYSNVNNAPNQFSKNLPQVDSIIKEHSVFIDSRDRNRDLYPNTNEFVVHFDGSGIIDSGGAVVEESYSDIHSIELVHCVLPNSVIGVTGSHYLTLEIPELDNSFTGTNDTLQRAFGYLSPTDAIGTTHVATKFYRRTRKVFSPPKASLGKLTLRFRKPDGTLFDFGTDTATGNPVTEDVQVLVHLDIHTIHRKPTNLIHFR